MTDENHDNLVAARFVGSTLLQVDVAVVDAAVSITACFFLLSLSDSTARRSRK